MAQAQFKQLFFSLQCKSKLLIAQPWGGHDPSVIARLYDQTKCSLQQLNIKPKICRCALAMTSKFQANGSQPWTPFDPIKAFF